MGTILDRGYVFKRGTALVPAFLAFAVVSLLEQHFGQLVDYSSRRGWRTTSTGSPPATRQRLDWLRRFYFGADGDGRPEGARLGPRRDRRARDQLAAGRRRDRAPSRPLRAVRRARRGARERPGGSCARRADAREGRGAPGGAERRPLARRASRVASRELVAAERALRPLRHARCSRRARTKSRARRRSSRRCRPRRVTLEDAVRLLTLPRMLGRRSRRRRGGHGSERTYGPYVKKGADSRSLDARGAAPHDHARGGACAARPAEAATRPGSGEAAAEGARARSGLRQADASLKEGRFGPYVTDGETNASLRRGDDPESITVERAIRAARRPALQGAGPEAQDAIARSRA